MRDARLTDLASLEAERQTALWTDAHACYQALTAAIMHTGFAACAGELPHWRATFRATHLALERMLAGADSLASSGMPTTKADADCVRERRRALQKGVEADLAQVEALEKACEELKALFSTLKLFQDAAPLRATPSS